MELNPHNAAKLAAVGTMPTLLARAGELATIKSDVQVVNRQRSYRLADFIGTIPGVYRLDHPQQ